MKSVLMSTQPRWVVKICNEIDKRADGTPVYEKEIEVRKTRPKLQTPFKVYIYCSKYKYHYIYDLRQSTNGEFSLSLTHYNKTSLIPQNYWNGKVIGEFVCDKITEFNLPYPVWFSQVSNEIKDLIKNACLTMSETHNYIGTNKGYAWHILNLKIYDEPKELSEFYHACNQPKGTDCSKCIDDNKRNCCSITRPPQSWCYVEEL